MTAKLSFNGLHGRTAQNFEHHSTLGVRFGDPLRVAIQMLIRAAKYAEDTRSSRWEFAVELVELQRAGVSTSELRWLLTRKYALHAEELTPDNGSGRKFRRLGPNAFPPGSCFVLSDRGLTTLHALVAGSNSSATGPHANLLRSAIDTPGQVERFQPTAERTAPVWDERRRQLCFRNLVVKLFRCRAPMQETIIAAFQEEHWAARVDDPLPHGSEQDRRRRLHDTIRSLNRNQVNRLIRFRGDGSGDGILWQPR